ncbi:MAG: flagellar hook capping FlgD N-terminal domain-containing protein [Terracidiphilus sp.]
MAAAATGIWNHLSTAGLPGATAMDSSTSGTDNSSSTDSATISANDFLTLLVTEMQNQDPTADTDPNEYINQLVNVNSLEQLIDINQTLSSATGGTGTAAPTGHVSQVGAISASESGTATSSSSPANHAKSKVQNVAAAANQTMNAIGPHRTPGNLGIPDANPAAQRVALSLSGRHLAS